MSAEIVALAEAVIRTATRPQLERAVRAQVGRVFRRQANAFPAADVVEPARLIAGVTLAEVANPDPADPYLSLVVNAWPDEAERIAATIVSQGVRVGMTSMNLTLARIGYPEADSLLPVVRDFIARSALEHAESIERTSVLRVREILVRGVEGGQDARTIARAIRQEMAGWSKARAETIARTEVATAWEGAQYEVLAANGWAGREWLTANDERVDAGNFSGPCVENQAAGVVPIGAPFPSGHLFPPAHPNCRCTVVPAFE